jgi:hypothetical protein|tara:strand:- start:129 stop:314 length:186 start_codon:yes stop_codon:yes gene_type:complete
MKIRDKVDREFQVSKIDIDNDVEFNVQGGGNYVTAWLNISETIELIKFLQEQVDTYTNKMI